METEQKTHPKSAGYVDDYRVYHLNDSEDHWFVGNRAFSALKGLAVESCGYKTVQEYLEDGNDLTIRVLSWDERVVVRDENNERDVTESKTAAEWAVSERGMFCSSCS